MPNENGVFPHDYCFAASGNLAPSPGNIDEMRERAFRRRPSHSAEKFTDADIGVFKFGTMISRDEKDIMELHLEPGIVCGTPDMCHGSDVEHADLTVRKKLGDMILPSKNKEMPMAPNFFLEVKSLKGNLAEANLQALHTCALGERGQMATRGWHREGLGLDEKAHTITGTYSGGMLTMYSIHAGRHQTYNDQLEFYMNKIVLILITDNAEGFRRGISMYQNLRDFADEQRNESIAMANEMAYPTGKIVSAPSIPLAKSNLWVQIL
ncbi:hypothetical protein EPUL_005996, partial [Erysiphe pulchra]